MNAKFTFIILAAVAIAHIEASSLHRMKRQQQQSPLFASLLTQPLSQISQANPVPLVQNGASGILKNFPQPLRFKRQQPFQPIFTLFADPINRVAMAFEDLTGAKQSSSTTITTTTSTTPKSS